MMDHLHDGDCESGLISTWSSKWRKLSWLEQRDLFGDSDVHIANDDGSDNIRIEELEGMDASEDRPSRPLSSIVDVRETWEVHGVYTHSVYS